MAPEAILFDLDGTLIDRRSSLGVFARHFLEMFSSHLPSVCLEAVADVIVSEDADGYRAREDVLAGLLGALPWKRRPSMEELLAHWYATFPGCTVARPGLHETLLNLRSRGFRMGLVTNGSVRMQRPKIEAMGLPSFMETVIISEAVGISKPNAEIFLLALSNLGMEADEAWYVGDHPANDIIGASAAGLTPVWLRGIHPWPDGRAEPLLQIDSLAELISLLPPIAPLSSGRSLP